MTPQIKTAPEIIYLQHDAEDTGLPFDHAEGVTWCRDKINASDIAYVREDINVAALEAARQEEREAWMRKYPFAIPPGEGQREDRHD